MIVSRVIGGLGNQMFQYAVGYTLALQYGVPLRLDIQDVASYVQHQGFELFKVFDCSTDIATKEDIQYILGLRGRGTLRKILMRQKAAMFRGDNFVVEPHFQYWPNVTKVPIDCYLVGYWQSEKYFQDVASNIRSQFIFKDLKGNVNCDLAKQIGQITAVSVHVRRGDYATDKKTMASHGLCSLEYYRAAIKYISHRVKQPHFFVFSDDIDWVKKHLKIKSSCQYVTHNRGADSYNDMHLMSLCSHHIIANSSFSWWGAWLNPCGDKIVVAPQRWFANDNDVKDLIPSGWVTL